VKLILTQEVSGLGSPGDVVEVKDGYGRNYLVPRALAIAWTRGGERQVEAIRQGRASREVRDLGSAQELKARLEATPVQLAVRAGAGGRLFGSVTPADIASAVTAAGGPQVDKRRVEVRSPIKVVGEHAVTVRLHSDVAATVRLDVVPG
jgi:large subunit ribosomal protein L9